LEGTEPVRNEVEDHARTSLLDDLARRYSPSLKRFFSRKSVDRNDIADLVQDVFLRLAKLKNLSSIEKPEHYLFVAASSALKDRLRSTVSRETLASTEFDDALHGCSDLTPERVLAGRQAIARLDAVLRELPTRTRDIFVLRVLEDYRMADIARTIGISQRAVEKHFAKAMVFVTTRMTQDRDV
jgi:RNA polymerase sigma factor (sigma-70 family)